MSRDRRVNFSISPSSDRPQIYEYDLDLGIYHNDLYRNNSVINLKKLSSISQGYYHELVNQ